MKKNILVFLGAAGLSFGASAVVGGEKLAKFYSSQNCSEYLRNELRDKTYEEFTHEYTDLMEVSKLHVDDKNRSVRYLYYPTLNSQGYPGVCHGGFSYSVCLLIAEEHAKRFGITSPIKKTFMKYTAPIKAGGLYVVETSEEAGVLKVEVKDSKNTKYSLMVTTYAT
jgi:hypothetical protein